MKVKIKKIHPDAILPNYAHPGDAGLDLYSIENDYKLQPGERKVFGNGFALEIENGYVGIVKDKGGPPTKYGLHTMGGVFDSGYRGDYNVLLINLGPDPIIIKKGQKIAQLVILPIITADLEETDELSDSSRQDGRWGSTGEF